MMVTPRSLAFLIIPFLWFGFVFSVTPVIAQFGSEKGLPFVTNYDSRTINATQVWSLIQNDEGIIYAGIQNGFAEYDGVRWRKIVSRVGVGTGGTIRSMAKSDSGLIYYGDFADLGYIGTDSIGNAKCFSMLDYIPTRYRDFFDIWSLYTAPEGIYVQSREYIFLVKPGSKPDTSTTRIWTPQSLFMYAFYMDGDYFVHQQGLGLYKLAGDSLKLVPGSEFLGKERVQTMLAYPAGPNGEKRWLIGMFYSGLYLYNGTTFTPFKTGADRLLQSGGLLYKGIRLRDGTYALASAGNGVALIDSAGNLLQHLDLSSGLQDNNIYGLHQDRAGMLWMALDNGVSRAAIGGSLTLFGKSAGLQGSVLSVGRSGGIIYAGTSRSVFGYNPAGGSFSQVPGTPPNQVFDMLRDDDGMLIPSDGLYAIKDGKGFPIIRSVSGDLSLTAIWRSRHHPGVLLVGGALGVNVFTRQQVPGKKGSVSDWKPLGSIPGIYNQVWSFSEEKDGTMWAGTQSGTVYRLRLHFEGSPVPNLEKTEIETFKREESAVKLIGDVYSIAGTTYFGRDSGLAKYDNAAKEFKQDFSFGTFNTLEEGQTIFLKEDTEGRVWINVGKHSRLAVPKPGGGYDLNDNILSQLSDFNLSYFYPEGNGIVWIGTTDGLLRFDANMVSELSSAFKTLLRHVSVGKSGQLQATPVSVSAPSSFSYQNSSIRFDFSAPFFDQEHKTVYQTLLDGFDKDWSEWDNNHYKEYTNLSPRKYTFRVRAKNIYNTIGEEATYSFLIMAPWYSTPWAYLLYFIIAAAIIYAFVNYRTRQLHARHRELEKEVELRTGELSHRVEELAVINSVQEALVSELDMNGIYELVGEKLREIFKVDVIDIVTYDDKTGLIEDRYANEKGDRTLLPAREPAGFRKYVIETGEVVAINENLAEEGRKFGNEVLIGDVPISGVWVPMTSGNKITGIISLQDLTNEHSFPQGSVNLISTLANSMSVALESARRFDETKTLLKETEQRTAELAVINSVQEGLARELDIQAIYELVGEKMREIFNAQVIDIVTYNSTTRLIEDRYAYEKGDRSLLGPREPVGFRRHVIETGKTLFINENLRERAKTLGNTVLIGQGAKSLIMVPRLTAGEVTGVISVQNVDMEHAFTESDLNLLTTLVNSMSVALENARLFDETNRLLKETEQRTAELAVINSVQEGLVREMDIDAIYELVGEKMREIFSAQVIDIVTYDDKTNLISDRYAYEKGDRSLLPPREPAGFRKQLLATGEMILYNTGVAEAIEKIQDKVVIGETPKSVVFFPLKTSGKVNGVISLQNLDHEHAFSDSDIKLLATLSNSMSVALQNARLFDETNSLLKETEQRTAELAVINSVQEGLARELDIQAIYELVGEKMREIFNAQVIDIVTYNSTTRLIEDRYAYEKGDRSLLGPREAGGFRKHVLTTGEMLVHNEKVEEACEAYNNPVLIGEMPKSQVFYPLITGSKVNGVISLQNLDRNHAFSDSDIKLLATLSNSMSVALQNARLFDETNSLLKETEQRTAELAVINSVQEGLARELDIQAIYELVGEKMREIFNAQVIDIVTYNPNTRLIEDRYSYEKGDRSLLGPRAAGGFRMHVLTTGEMLVHNEKVEEACAAYNNPVLIGEMPKSQVFYPLITGSKVNGVISLQNLDRNHAFSDSDIKLLATLSNSMSVALQNARLFDETNSLLKETEQRNAELAVINSVQDGLVREMDMQGIYELVGEQIREAFDAQVIDIVTYDKKLNLIEDSYSYEKGDRTRIGPREATGFRKHVIETGKPLLINDKMLERAEALGNTVLFGESSKSLIMVPRLAAGEVTGVISLQNLDREQAYTESDIKLLTTLVNSMSVALENARLFDETNRLLKETEQRTAELAVINSVQEGLAKELDMQGIYNLVGDRLCELFPDSHAMVIRTFDYDTGLEHWMYAKEKGEDQDVPPRPFNWNSRLLMETKKSLHIGKDYVAVSVQHGGTGVTAGKPPKSAVFVPMMVGEVVKGSVSLQNVDKENSFTDSDLRLLTTITNSMSVALENARLFDETHRLLHEAKQRANELSTVNSISRALASQLNLDELINLVGDQLRQLFSANIVYLAVLDSKTKIINFPYQYGDNMMPMKMGEGFTSQIIRTQKSLLINKDLQDLRNQLGVEQIGLPAASYLGVPIPVGDEVIGVLSVQSTEQENRFDEQDLRLLSTIAASVGVAMRKAGLFEDLKVAQQEAEVARHTAEKANEAKSAFLSTVSHELRTPLTSVLGFAKIIKKRLEEKVFPLTDISDPKTVKVIGQVSDNLDVVVSEGQRLTHLINDVLDLAKIEAGKMEWNVESVSVAEIAERAMAATTSLFDQNNLELEKDIATDIPTVSGDKDKLIQVMVNLISNAVKFTPAGKVTCSVYQQDQEIVVSISDTGIGIAPGDHSAVFEQFRQVGDTLTDKPKGTGLGLPICKEIVEHHGGRLWMESILGKGSTFSFALPVTGAELQQAAPLPVEDLIRQLKEQVAQSKLHSKDKISRLLVVDDDDSIRSLLQQELTEAGYLVEEASNGKQALACVRANKPDLIILDIMMPEMNGFDVAAVLKNDPQTMDIPIIVLSIVQDKIRGFRIGVDRYLTKPIDTGLLFNEIGSLLEQGKSKKKVMVVDENTGTVNSLTEVLKARGYIVVESNGNELVENAIASQPDIIIMNSLHADKQHIVKTLRFEKGLENVLFLVYQ